MFVVTINQKKLKTAISKTVKLKLREKMKEINIPVLEGLFTWESRAIDYPLEVLAELTELKKQKQVNSEIDQHMPVKDIESPNESD